MDGWMDGLRLYILFNSISVISEWWEVDNERLCVIELRLKLCRFPPPATIECSQQASASLATRVRGSN